LPCFDDRPARLVVARSSKHFARWLWAISMARRKTSRGFGRTPDLEQQLPLEPVCLCFPVTFVAPFHQSYGFGHEGEGVVCAPRFAVCHGQPGKMVRPKELKPAAREGPGLEFPLLAALLKQEPGARVRDDSERTSA
jgi:hypothetical protein